MSLSMPNKEYYAKNREKYLQAVKLYRQTEKGKIMHRLSSQKYANNNKNKGTKNKWKHQGIICDFDAIYDIYINTHKCDHCNKEFKSSCDKGLDHCHTCGTVRAILCNSCNRWDRVKCYLC